MKVLLITVGSRGDNEPFMSLAKNLSTKGHSVDLFMQPEYSSLLNNSINTNNNNTTNNNTNTNTNNNKNGAINLHPLPFCTNDFYKFMSPSKGADHKNPRVRFIGVVTDIIAGLVFPCWERVLQEALGSQQEGGGSAAAADVIICSSLARPLAVAIAAKVQIPVGIVHLQPLAPTGYFPHYSNEDDSVAAILNMTTTNIQQQQDQINTVGNISSNPEFEEIYVMLERYQHEFLQEPLANLYEKLGLDMIDFDADLLPILKGRHGTTTSINNNRKKKKNLPPAAYIFNAYPEQLVPTCPDAGPKSFHVGALADTMIFPENWVPPQGLIDFINEEEGNKEGNRRPICVGFGSMPFQQVSTILTALEQFGERAIIVGMALQTAKKGDDHDSTATSNTISDWAKKHVFALPSGAPYPWLLPQCSMMVCHGGAGVVSATMRAGIPCIVAPLMGDQFAWAQLLEKRGLGVRCGSANLMALESDQLVEALEKAHKQEEGVQNEEENGGRARAMGESIRAGSVGVDILVKLLEEEVTMELPKREIAVNE